MVAVSGAGPNREVESWDGLDPIYDTVGQDTGGRDDWDPTDVPEGAFVDLEGEDERIAKATIARAATYCLSHTGIDVVEDGHNQAAYGYGGSDLRQATILDRYEPEVNALIRRASVDTLGPSNTSFDCLQERAADEVRVDVPPLGAGAADDRELDATAGNGNGEEPTAVDTTLAPEERADAEETTTCNGTPKPIDQAPRFLEDEAWFSANQRRLLARSDVSTPTPSSSAGIASSCSSTSSLWKKRAANCRGVPNDLSVTAVTRNGRLFALAGGAYANGR